MKGISPMLSTILLVAFTVAIGGIISVWMSSFTRTTTSNVESASTNQTKCSGTYIDITSFTSGGITFVNRGDQTITDIRCFTGNGTNVTGGAVASLAPGAIQSGAFTYVSAQGTVVTCSGKCLSVGVTGQCKSGESCWTAS
jgi:flagellin-like protein